MGCSAVNVDCDFGNLYQQKEAAPLSFIRKFISGLRWRCLPRNLPFFWIKIIYDKIVVFAGFV